MAGTGLLGTGIAISFATSGFTGKITGVKGGDASVPVLDSTHMGTTNSRTKLFGDLLDEGEIDVDIQFDPSTPPPVGTEEAITITFRVPDGMTTGATFVFQGGISKRNWEGPLDDLMTGSYTITITDEVTVTAAT